VTKVSINGHSHQVEIEDDGDLDTVVSVARKLWDDTLQPESGPAGPAFGFSAERAHRRGGFAWNLGQGGQPAVSP
jgi:hypothetical protein